MANSRSTSTGKLILLDDHLATGTEATYTYTATHSLKSKYRAIIVYIEGSATAALEMWIKVNAHTNYDENYLQQNTTTVSCSVAADVTHHTLLTSTQIDAGGKTFTSKTIITLDDSLDKLVLHSIGSQVTIGTITTHAVDETSVTDITSIETKTSTSTWIAGTRITTYGLI